MQFIYLHFFLLHRINKQRKIFCKNLFFRINVEIIYKKDHERLANLNFYEI